MMSEANVILTTALGLCLGAMGYMLKREFSQRDKAEARWNELSDRWETAFHSVTLSLHELNANLRSWTSEQFVRRAEHEKDIDRLKSDTFARIDAASEHYQRDIEIHKATCKGGK